jgi:VCBS repeat-containing protein
LAEDTAIGEGRVLRLNANGTLDSSFANGGELLVEVDGGWNELRAVKIDSSNRPVFVGDAESNGSHDSWLLRIKPQDDIRTTTYNSALYSADVFPLALKDGKGFGGGKVGKTDSTLTIPDSFNIHDLNVQLDITHTWDADLDVYLLGPDGTTRVELFTDAGNGGSNFFDGIILDSEASTPITSGIVGTRRYQPEGDLSDFNTLNTAGTWTLQIEDDEKFNVGTLNSWSITVTHPTPGPNDPPTALADTATTNEDTAVVIDVLANDTDPDGDPLSVTAFDALSANDATISVAPDGSITYDPTGSQALQDLPLGQSLIDTFSYTIGDGNGGSSSATVIVTVNGLDETAGMTVTGIDTPSALPGDQLTVKVFGTNFVDGAAVDFGKKVNVQNVTFISAVELTVQIKVHRRAADGPRHVTVTNPDNSSDVCENCFFVGTPVAASAQSSGPLQSSNLSRFDETSTETSIIQPTDPTLLNVEPILIEEEPDEESPTQDDTEVQPEHQADLDALFGNLDDSLQEDLLTV